MQCIPLVDILLKHDMKYHLYADDTQLYQCTNENNLRNLLADAEKCIHDVKMWMNTNKLKLNDSKRKLIISQNSWSSRDSIVATLNINKNNIVSSSKVKNLGVIFDKDLIMTDYVDLLCKSLLYTI